MNIKKYEAFIRAVELGSLSKAAEELGYTQSGISHMMQSLEEEVGFPLLVRTSSGILPNAEGETLLPAIRRLLRTNDALAQTIAQIKGADSGRVRVIAFSSAAACWLPEVICRFQRDFPHVEVMLREADGDTIDAVMEAHEADLCLDAGGAARSVEWLPLCQDQLMAVLPKGHRLARERAVSLEALQQERLLLPLKGYGRAAHQMLDQLSGNPAVRFIACSDYTILSMVEAGLGISILPELLLEHTADRVVSLPLEPAQYRTLGMGMPCRNTASPAVRNFAAYVRAYVRELDAGQCCGAPNG